MMIKMIQCKSWFEKITQTFNMKKVKSNCEKYLESLLWFEPLRSKEEEP